MSPEAETPHNWEGSGAGAGPTEAEGSSRRLGEHRGFLNSYYGVSRHIYDLTRKYYLFGRDAEIDALLREEWTSLVEVGPGTGRNLNKLQKRRPEAFFGGIEASDAMLEHARRKCTFARFEQGFAETADIANAMGRRPERILFSYCLSMVQSPEAAIENARRALAPGGEIVIVDFSDFAGLPVFAAAALSKWLKTFHVHPVAARDLREWGGELSFGPGRYFVRARFRR